VNALAKNKFVSSLAILAIATSAVFAPDAVILLVGVAAVIFLILHFPFFGIAAIVVAAFLGEFGRVEFAGFSFLILDIVAISTFAIWILRKMWRKEKIIFDQVGVALLIFWGIAILSLIFGSFELANDEVRFAFLRLLRFVGISGMFFVARDLPKKMNRKADDFLIFGGTIFALAGFILLRMIPDFESAGLAELGWDPHIGRLTGTFLDPNFAAGAFAFLLALVGGKFLGERKLGRKILFLISGGILGIALILTFSRSGLLALGISGLILGIFVERKILLAMLVVGFLAISTSPRLAERIGEFGKSLDSLGGESVQVLDPTAQLRFESWWEGGRIFAENPVLGVGFGGYKFAQNFAAEDSHSATGSDASILNVAAETGIFGLSAFLFFLGNLIFASWRKKEFGFLAALGGILAHSVFVNSIFFAPIGLIFFLAAGLATKNYSK